VGVAITEINYASAHPFAYGPAKVIAWAAGAGALVSVAVADLASTSGTGCRERRAQWLIL
jgi:hypothetical protein